MSKTDMARLMARRGVRPRTREREVQEKPLPTPSRGRRLADAFHEVPPGEAQNPQSVFQIPDSWESRAKVKKPLPEEEKPDKRRGPKKKASHKRRGTALNFCVSEEEAFLLRKHAHDKGLNFSEWARTVLFKAAGHEIPSRE